MKSIEKCFKVELTEEEIGTLTDALHHAYMYQRGLDKPNGAKMCAVRALRNDFASLINCHYTGEDA